MGGREGQGSRSLRVVANKTAEQHLGRAVQCSLVAACSRYAGGNGRSKAVV